MSRRLFQCVVFNHPFAKCNSFWELEGDHVQEIKMKQGHNVAGFDGYVGLMYPFKDLEDAVVEINYKAKLN